MKYSPLFLFDNFVLTTKSFKEGYLMVKINFNIQTSRKFRFIIGISMCIFVQYIQEKRVENLKKKVIDQNIKLKFIQELEI